MKEHFGDFLVSQMNIAPRVFYEWLLTILCLGIVIVLVLYWDNSRKLITRLILFEYLIFIFGLTVIYREESQERLYLLTPFWNYNIIYRNRNLELLFEVVMNVIWFIPVGFLFGTQLKTDSRKQSWFVILLLGIGFSLGIELLQLLFKKGYFEVDDIIHNSVGCLIGYLFWLGISKVIIASKRLKCS